MTKRLYKLMDWARIEGVVYSEEDNPHEFLGLKKVLGGCLIQAFIPYAKKVYAVIESGKEVKEYKMELADEEGFFAVFVPKLTGIDKLHYYFRAVDEKGIIREVEDPYSFETTIEQSILDKFNAGICYDIYNYLGAHLKEINGIKGVSFAVWAPNAIRVSVVGNFNNWDGRLHQMRRLGESGVFEIFIPGVNDGDIYKYELKLKGARISLKADPYGFSSQLRPDTASIVSDIYSYKFDDKSWIENRKQVRADKPMAIYEVNLSTFKADDVDDFPNYRDIAKELCDYVKDTGYTHIEIMPIMEYPLDESLGFQSLGYFAPTKRYGNPEDFMYFIDYMHKNGIGVILDWVPSHFPMDDHGLVGFDGTCLYEHQDPRQGLTSDGQMSLFNYGRSEVSNYLISNALFWINMYHTDGIKVSNLGEMLYLDYGKQEGEYIANLYGGNENLDAIEMLKHLNSINYKTETGAMIIADGSCDYPMLTEHLKKGGLGFYYKWNKGFEKDLSEFMFYDPVYRAAHYDELTLSMIYAYSEYFILPLSHEEAISAGGSVLNRFPGCEKKKRANMRLMMGYMFAHPGKKLIYMDHRIKDSEESGVAFIKELLKLYKQTPALYELDETVDGFEWVDNISADENIIAFIRKAKSGDLVLVVCNFADLAYEKHEIGVPYAGKYKEIFNSDASAYGGTDLINKRVKTSKEKKCKGMDNTIVVNMAPLSISIFNYIKQPTA